MEKRKIALLTAAWDTEMLEPVIEGVKERLEGTGWDLHVFMCFPGFGINNPDNFSTYNIFSLPNYDDYEGFLLSVNGIQGYEMIQKYHPKLFKIKKPMVSLEKEIEGLTTVIPDGYKAMYQLVEHLITKHGCRTLNYVGGPSDHADNIIRKKAFMDALAVHGIPVEERRIREYSFVAADGRQAYLDFKKIGIEFPNAVVCASDAMALGYCQAAEEDGKYPPEDFLITGYDNDENARNFTPKITSIDKKARLLGYVACDELFKIIENKEVEKQVMYEPELVLRGSCGCYAPEELEEYSIRELNRRMYCALKEEAAYHDMVAMIRQNLALATSEGMFNYFMAEVLRNYDIFGFSLCINQEVHYSTLPIDEDKWETGYSKSQYVFSSMWEKFSQEEPVIINTRDLIPDYLVRNDEKTHIYMYCSVYKASASLGYLAVADGTCLLKRNLLRQLVLSINGAYTNLRNLENLRKINKRLDSIYTKDAMTELYNRFGYMRDGYEMYERSKVSKKPLMVMFMDMDGLKNINDTYGHSQGDEALIRFAEVLRKCTADEKIAVRYGGDEFLIIGPVDGAKEAEAFKRELENQLKTANEEGNAQYLLEASIGYVLTDPRSKKELDAYVEEADSLMYEVKKRNKKQRQ